MCAIGGTFCHDLLRELYYVLHVSALSLRLKGHRIHSCTYSKPQRKCSQTNFGVITTSAAAFWIQRRKGAIDLDQIVGQFDFERLSAPAQ